MVKLFSQKEWLTVAEAAKHLERALEEGVTEADVLRLGLDERLQLSVYFVNGVKARCGSFSFPLTKRIFGEEGYEPPSISKLFYVDSFKQDVRDIIERDFLQIPYNLVDPGKHEDDPRHLEALVVPLGPPTTISGIYDLALSCGVRDDVQKQFCKLMGMPVAVRVSKEPIIVFSQDGCVCEILDECLGPQLNVTDDTCRPACCLPSDGVFVVRTNELESFIRTCLTETLQAAAPGRANENTTQRRKRIKDYVESADVKARAFEDLAKIDGCGVENIKRIYKDAKRMRIG